MLRLVSLLGVFIAPLTAQQGATVNPETHPSLSTYKCTLAGGCVQQATKVVIDSNWRWLHNVGGYTNCFDGSWNSQYCPDPVSCAANCALDGADYVNTYGISTTADALTLKFVTGSNVGSRVYLMGPSDTQYQLFQLKNQEFAFDVDASQLQCGMNGAVYFTGMDADGGVSRWPGNTAGAKYGTGYCDAQCPQDIKFIDGEANLLNWNPSTSTGQYGSCCSEVDIWEANMYATAYTGHPCTVTSQTRCSGTDCSATGFCDQAGCDFNPYRMGNKTFFGPSASNSAKTNSKITVVTQFITSNNLATGTLTSINRLYVQNGVVIANSASKIKKVKGNKITNAFCKAQKKAFGDTNYFSSHGGMSGIDAAMQKGMVLTMSIWDDHATDMLWLDSIFPVGGNAQTPGVLRGPCDPSSGNPSTVEADYPNAAVTFSNIRWGDIGSTY